MSSNANAGACRHHVDANLHDMTEQRSENDAFRLRAGNLAQRYSFSRDGHLNMEVVIFSELAMWLRQERRKRGWPVMEMGRRLCEAARASGDNTVPGKQAMCRNVRRWESGHGGVSERYMLHYCKAFGIQPQAFGPALAPGDEPVLGGTPAPPHHAGRAIPAVNPGLAGAGDTNRGELLCVLGIARALLAAREFLAATAEVVGPDTPSDELWRHLTRYRAHLSALAAGDLPPARAERTLAGCEAGE
jgi:hypothetical protein